MKTIVTLAIAICCCFLNNAQTIEKFSIDSGGASVTAAGIDMLYTIGEVNIQELSVGNVQVSEGFINADFRVLIHPIVFLQGPILNPSTPGLMNDDLRVNALIPTTSPYADNATVNATVFDVTGNDAIVDWVWLELRASDDNSRLINARSALVQRDGDVVDTDGVSNVIMQASSTSYYVVIKHRNHLGVMSLATIGLSDNTTTVVDFTNSAFATFGNNAQAELDANTVALWSGDVNASNSITFSGTNNDVNAIKDYVLLDPMNVLNFITFSSTGYLNEDLDLNGFARFSGSPNDSNIIKDNVLNHPLNFLNLPTYNINTTVPAQN
ncbi:hemagglutinin protein [Psychroserpens sp. SPM9]|uniref:hemagglutinin protein n=1 Tax=Psychroserpens sp. SPM9 TaxID=2975598 RepID=UPI0021A77426|nr:hemagglutinin protein [Psychroserpens sp. SPM9]MDG5491224.1 hemagglutinin protein [Psychroserpens sp. SPM9]